MANQKKGYVLLYVVITIMLALLLSQGLYQSVFLANILARNTQINKEAYYNALAGVEYARYRIKSENYTVHTGYFDLSSSGVASTVDIASDGDDPPTYTITSTGQSFGINRTIVAICLPTGDITSIQ